MVHEVIPVLPDDPVSRVHAANQVPKDLKVLTALKVDLALLVPLVLKVKLVLTANKVLPVLKVKLVLEDKTDKTVTKVLTVLQVLLNLLVSSLLSTVKTLMLPTVQLVPSNFGMVTLCYTPLATITTMLKILVNLVLVSNGSTPVHLPSVTEMTLVDTLAETENLTG